MKQRGVPADAGGQPARVQRKDERAPITPSSQPRGCETSLAPHPSPPSPSLLPHVAGGRQRRRFATPVDWVSHARPRPNRRAPRTARRMQSGRTAPPCPYPPLLAAAAAPPQHGNAPVPGVVGPMTVPLSLSLFLSVSLSLLFAAECCLAWASHFVD